MHRTMITGSMKYIRQFNKDLWVLSFGWFVSALGFGISIPFISIYFHSKLGLTISQIGLFFGFMAVVRSIFQALGGEISDHFERPRILIFSQLFRAAAFMLLGLLYTLNGITVVALQIPVTGLLAKHKLSIQLALGAFFYAISYVLFSKKLPDRFNR